MPPEIFPLALILPPVFKFPPVIVLVADNNPPVKKLPLVILPVVLIVLLPRPDNKVVTFELP